jgi:hypothetical protein
VESCIARPNLLRCVGCFLFPFAALGAYVYKITSVGVPDVQSYVATVLSGGWNAASAVFFVGGSLAWVLITWPKARAAVGAGGCAISVDQGRVHLYGEAIERSEITSTEIVRTAFDFELQVLLKNGSVVTRSVALLSPSPDRILASLREHNL